jgi:hypothetical protein
LAQRRKVFATSGPIRLDLGPVSVSARGDGQVETRFRQSYRSAQFADTVDKVLVWTLIDGQARVISESKR